MKGIAKKQGVPGMPVISDNLGEASTKPTREYGGNKDKGKGKKDGKKGKGKGDRGSVSDGEGSGPKGKAKGKGKGSSVCCFNAAHFGGCQRKDHGCNFGHDESVIKAYRADHAKFEAGKTLCTKMKNIYKDMHGKDKQMDQHDPEIAKVARKAITEGK
jgi:hypothetical protein